MAGLSKFTIPSGEYEILSVIAIYTLHPMKIKIVHITSVHSAYDIRIFHKECKTLAKAGYDIKMIAPHDLYEKVDGVQIIPLPKPKNRLYRMSLTLWQIYWLAIRENADIYHIHDPELLILATIFRYKEKKVIYDIHEDIPRAIIHREWLPFYWRKIISSLAEIIENWNARKMSLLIAATPFIKSRFSRKGYKTVTINNFPIKNELISITSEHYIREKAVCYIGGIDYNRCIREILRSLEKTDAELFLAGLFSSDKEKKSIMLLPGWKKVRDLGQINRKEVARVLGKCQAGLVLYYPHPNHINAQPNKMFEYMSAGLPVIASHFPLWRDIIEKNHCGLCCDPLNPDEIARCIQWIIEHKEEAHCMGRNGRRAVEEKYNWDAQSKIFLNEYEKLLRASA